MSGKAEKATESSPRCMPEHELIVRRLDQLVAKATRHLKNGSLTRGLQESVEFALVLLLAGPFFLLSLQVVLVLTESRVELPGLWALIALTLLPPVLYVAGRLTVIYVLGVAERPLALALFDQQLDLQDRLLTADEFLGVARRNGFSEAAIEDAAISAETALAAKLKKVAPPTLHVRSIYWLYAPAALAVLTAALWIGDWRIAADPSSEIAGSPPAGMTAEIDTDHTAVDNGEPAIAEQEPLDKRPFQKMRGDPPTTGEKLGDTEESQLRRQYGQPAEGRVSGASNASGQSSSDQALKNGTDLDGRPESARLEKPDSSAISLAASSEHQGTQSSGLDSGRAALLALNGSSEAESEPKGEIPQGGQNSNPSDSEVGEEKEPGNDDGQKSGSQDRESGGKKAAESDNSDTTISDAKSKNTGGKSEIKKSRGVPSMVLGVPLPDTISGTPNIGPTKITQEKSEPAKQSSTPRAAAAQTTRDAPIEHVEHPDLQPWMRQLVQNYFTETHKQSSKKED